MNAIELAGKDAKPTGIYVTSTIEDFDPVAFGEWLGKQSSLTQADVLTGMALYLGSIGHDGNMQIAYLVGDLRKQGRPRAIGEFIETLHAFWTGEW